MSRESQKELLDEIVDEWTKRLCKALVRVENRRRAKENLELIRENATVFLPGGFSALGLLTLKVWALRYDVSPEFMLDFLTEFYARNRKISAFSPNRVSLGLSVSLATGVMALGALEDAVRKTYANGENAKMLLQPAPPGVRFAASETDTVDHILVRYGDALAKARVRYDARYRAATGRAGVRPYRRSVREDVP